MLSCNRLILSTYLCFLSLLLTGQELSIVSWNISNFGRTRIEKYNNLEDFAQILKHADIVLIQEVVAKDPAGAKAVAILSDELNRTGSKWDYRVSDPTSFTSSQMKERYAFLWKTNSVKLKSRPSLLRELEQQVYREPYIAIFEHNGKELTILNYHSRKHYDKPELEIKLIIDYILELRVKNIIFGGDFNCNDSHEVFEELFKAGYNSALKNQGTTLKRECKNGIYLNHQIDNIYYFVKDFDFSKSGIIDIIGDCCELKERRNSLSDHVPVCLYLKHIN